MLGSLLHRFRPDPLRARVEASIRRGTGLSRREWLLGADPLTPATLQDIAGEISEWCRSRMSESRRPYGIDQMALAIACAEPGGKPLASTTFGVFRPIEFYAADGISEQLQGYMGGLPLEELNHRDGPIRFAAALFSWGDVARETIFSDEDTWAER